MRTNQYTGTGKTDRRFYSKCTREMVAEWLDKIARFNNAKIKINRGLEYTVNIEQDSRPGAYQIKNFDVLQAFHYAKMICKKAKNARHNKMQRAWEIADRMRIGMKVSFPNIPQKKWGVDKRKGR